MGTEVERQAVGTVLLLAMHLVTEHERSQSYAVGSLWTLPCGPGDFLEHGDHDHGEEDRDDAAYAVGGWSRSSEAAGKRWGRRCPCGRRPARSRPYRSRGA